MSRPVRAPWRDADLAITDVSLIAPRRNAIVRPIRSPACWRRPAPWYRGRNGPCRRDRGVRPVGPEGNGSARPRQQDVLEPVPRLDEAGHDQVLAGCLGDVGEERHVGASELNSHEGDLGLGQRRVVGVDVIGRVVLAVEGDAPLGPGIVPDCGWGRQWARRHDILEVDRVLVTTYIAAEIAFVGGHPGRVVGALDVRQPLGPGG